MILSEEVLCKCIEIARTHQSWREIGALVGCKESTMYLWLRTSRRDAELRLEGVSPFWIQHEGEQDWWHKFMKQSKIMFILGMEGLALESVAHGDREYLLD